MNQHQKILFVRYFFLHSGTEIRRAASVFKYEARSWGIRRDTSRTTWYIELVVKASDFDHREAPMSFRGVS